MSEDHIERLVDYICGDENSCASSEPIGGSLADQVNKWVIDPVKLRRFQEMCLELAVAQREYQERFQLRAFQTIGNLQAILSLDGLRNGSNQPDAEKTDEVIQFLKDFLPRYVRSVIHYETGYVGLGDDLVDSSTWNGILDAQSNLPTRKLLRVTHLEKVFGWLKQLDRDKIVWSNEEWGVFGCEWTPKRFVTGGRSLETIETGWGIRPNEPEPISLIEKPWPYGPVGKWRTDFVDEQEEMPLEAWTARHPEPERDLGAMYMLLAIMHEWRGFTTPKIMTMEMLEEAPEFGVSGHIGRTIHDYLNKELDWSGFIEDLKTAWNCVEHDLKNMFSAKNLTKVPFQKRYSIEEVHSFCQRKKHEVKEWRDKQVKSPDYRNPQSPDHIDNKEIKRLKILTLSIFKGDYITYLMVDDPILIKRLDQRLSEIEPVRSHLNDLGKNRTIACRRTLVIQESGKIINYLEDCLTLLERSKRAQSVEVIEHQQVDNQSNAEQLRKIHEALSKIVPFLDQNNPFHPIGPKLPYSVTFDTILKQALSSLVDNKSLIEEMVQTYGLGAGGHERQLILGALDKHALAGQEERDMTREHWECYFGRFNGTDHSFYDRLWTWTGLIEKALDGEQFLTESPLEDKCRHSDDFTSVIWCGQSYQFKKGIQSNVVRVLWEAWEKKVPLLGEETIGEKAGSESSRFRIRDYFRNHSAIGKMIISPQKGCWQLYS